MTANPDKGVSQVADLERKSIALRKGQVKDHFNAAVAAAHAQMPKPIMDKEKSNEDGIIFKPTKVVATAQASLAPQDAGSDSDADWLFATPSMNKRKKDKEDKDDAPASGKKIAKAAGAGGEGGEGTAASSGNRRRKAGSGATRSGQEEGDGELNKSRRTCTCFNIYVTYVIYVSSCDSCVFYRLTAPQGPILKPTIAGITLAQ